MAATRDDSGVVASRADRFRALCSRVEPGVRRALAAAYGPDVGSDAAVDAMSWAWEHLDRVEGMDNPGGYLWRVGQTAARRARPPASWSPFTPGDIADGGEVSFEPGLVVALAGLSDRQRASVVLVVGYGYPLAEAAEQMGCRVRTLRNHLERGMAKLRADLGVTDDD